MKTKIILFAFGIINLVCIQTACDKNNDGLDDKSGIFWVGCSGAENNEAVYYVSNSGDDDNDGLSESSAFKTIAKALSTVNPGGGIKITPGVYNESIGVQSCGSLSSAITIEGYNGVPVLDGENKRTIGLFFNESNNYIIRNLKIINYTDVGIGFSTGSNLILTNLEIAENGHAVQLKDWELEGYGIDIDYSDNIQISDCKVYRNGPEPQIVPDYIMGTGINTYGNTNVRINNNKSYNNIGGGILVEDSYEVIVEGNEVYGNNLDATVDEWWDGGLWLDGGANVIVRNNNFHDNKGPGIEISNEDRQNPAGYELSNNISTGNYFGIFIWNFGTNDWPDESIIKKSGNDFTGNSRQDVWIVDLY
ncbi:hypothetical protein MNBD_BACTEROID01-586 [hydrothermal vent metagenome]|uniref:Uncharacterized protein n=1 Tax=hydrothermal vent metagenome TaxID=652676 RepID=A0A3B0U5V2_9ZZZZ